MIVADAPTTLEDHPELTMVRGPDQLPVTRIRPLREGLSANDAAYVVPAEALNATLLTSDRRLASAAARWADAETV
ncbi:MAG: hypothetical protein JSS46_00265 [Proteobacteria bacterium]|nr:hypothetical protein [Pseudomonadota bacterium]